MLRWGAALAVMSACYQPALEEACSVRCDFAQPSCPGELQCLADGLCHDPGSSACPQHDARIDSPLLPGDENGSNCLGAVNGLFKYCPPARLDNDLTLGATLDTDSPECIVVDQNNGPEVCVIYAGTITIPNTVRVEGTRPLVLAAQLDISITGGIDVASRLGTAPGAGSRPAICDAGTAAATVGTGGGGGAGGSFQGSGGFGGFSGGGGQGVPGQTQTPTGIRGGCNGGMGTNGTAVGPAGSGGGAVYLLAGHSISMIQTGRINASGGPGRAGNGSGSGGGSGGMIGLDAPMLPIDGILMANGGGGSSGFNGSSADGNDSSSPGTGGAGGGAGVGPGGGGAGGTALLAGFPGGTVANGLNAGGAGGGSGWVVVYGATLALDPQRIAPNPSSP